MESFWDGEESDIKKKMEMSNIFYSLCQKIWLFWKEKSEKLQHFYNFWMFFVLNVFMYIENFLKFIQNWPTTNLFHLFVSFQVRLHSTYGFSTNF